MIHTIKYDDLPEELKFELQRCYWTKVNYMPLRELQDKTKLSINTLRKIRQDKEVSYIAWIKLREGLRQ